MELTSLIAKVIDPVLLLRALSILLDRKQFVEMVRGLEREATTVSFCLFPIALLMTCITLAVFHSDTSSVAAILVYVIACGGMFKVTTDGHALYFGIELNDQSLTPGDNPRIGATRVEDWLARSIPQG